MAHDGGEKVMPKVKASFGGRQKIYIEWRQGNSRRKSGMLAKEGGK